MPITKGHEGRKMALKAGGKGLDVWVFPKSLADERAVHLAQVKGEADGLDGLDAAATYIACMARRQSGEPVWKNASEVCEAMAPGEAEAAYRKILEVDNEIAEELGLGNP